MYYFLYKVNNINMKKILLIISLLFCIKVKAIENITINNENLSPVFNSDIKVYNYFTYSDSINIQVKSKENEQVTGSGVFSLNDDLTTFKVTSNDKEYTINVFKNYHKEELTPVLNDLIIVGYDINFDTNIHEYDIKSLRNIFAYTPQNNALFKGTIKENLSFDKRINADNLDEALSNAQIMDFIEKNEEGYDYELFQSGVNLSGGQRQRMSIARALLSGGECLLLDDSLSSVDYITDKRIRESIYKLYKDKMIILITQRVNNLTGFDKIIVIESGKIEMVGNYLDVVNTSKVFNEFIESQKREVSK